MKAIAVFFAVFFSLSVRGGDAAGNGGDVVICKTGSGAIESIELLDFYEAEQKQPPIKYSLGSLSMTVLEKVTLALERLSRLDLVRARAYQKKAGEFFGSTLFVEGPLEDIPDSGEVHIPSNCNIEQLAIQRKPVHPTDKRYLIDKHLWLELDNDHKAGLVLHEIIYGEALTVEHKDSRRARYFNSLVSSDELIGYDQVKYDQIVADIFRPEYTAAFKSHEFIFKTKASVPLNIDLKTLLKHQGINKLAWFTSGGKPQWLKVDSDAATMSGVPDLSDVGTTTFRLVVQDGDAGAIASIIVGVER